MSTVISDAIQLIKSNNIDEAIKILEKARTMEGAEAETIYTLGVCFFRKGKFTRALDTFKEYVDIDKRSADTHYYIGLCYERLGNDPESVEYFQLTLDLDKNHAKANEKLGVVDSNTFVSTDSGKLLYKSKRLPRTFGTTFIIYIFTVFLIIFLINMNHPSSHVTEQDLILSVFIGIFLVLMYIYRYVQTGTEIYSIYERRIDLRVGFFTKKEFSIWIYEIKNIEIYRGLWLRMSRSANLLIHTNKDKKYLLTGMAKYKFIESFRTELKTAIVERRKLKEWWL